MAHHLFVMPITGAGTQASPRAPKYASSVDGSGWTMCDGGTVCTILCDVSATALASITANADVAELPLTNIDVAPNAITGTKVMAVFTSVSLGISIPGGATTRQMARLAIENNQSGLIGKVINFALPTGSFAI